MGPLCTGKDGGVMVDRIQITTPTYMQLDGQWQIVQSGVVDVPSAATFRGVAVPIAETASALHVHGKPTSVRGVVKR